MWHKKAAFVFLIVIAVLFIQPILLSSSEEFEPSEKFQVQGCTAILAASDATLDGSVLFAKNNDLSEFDLSWLYYCAREHHPASSKVKLRDIEIPQSPTTWAWIGSKGPTWGGMGMGINEWGLAIGINDAPPREEKEKGVGSDELCRLVLERAENPADAAQLIGELITTYGFRGDEFGHGKIYPLANSTEAWIIEVTPRHWAAIKVRGVKIIANQFQITTDWDLGSEDLVEYAIERGWCKTREEFSFARCYSAEGYPFASSHRRMERGLELLEPKLGKICPENLMEVLRDHYEDTELYWYPPHENPSYRPICVGRTSASMVCHLKSWMPRQLQLMWYSVCPPCESVFIPVYAGTTEIFKPWRSGVGGEDWTNYTSDSAWWRFKRLQYHIEKNYEVCQPLVRERWGKFYQKELGQTQKFEKKVEKMLRRGKTDQAQLELNKFVNKNLEEVYEEVNSLSNEFSSYANS
jgi:dipeptidase